jgi:hypothetical protein
MSRHIKEELQNKKKGEDELRHIKENEVEFSLLLKWGKRERERERVRVCKLTNDFSTKILIIMIK